MRKDRRVEFGFRGLTFVLCFGGQIVHYEEKARILTLKDLTIEVIAKNVEDVESLGNIGCE